MSILESIARHRSISKFDYFWLLFAGFLTTFVPFKDCNFVGGTHGDGFCDSIYSSYYGPLKEMKLICRSDPPIIQAISGRYGPKDGEMKYIWGPWNGSTSQHENIYSKGSTPVIWGRMRSNQFKNDPR